MNDPMDSYKGMGVTWDGDRVVVDRVTREARVKVVIGRGPREEPKLGTGLAFFDHMLEMIAWHGALNLTVEFERKTFALRHVVCAGLSCAGRAMHVIARESDGARAEGVEDMTGADMVAFYEGFAQGARCTLHLRAVSGNDPHHTWEAVSRAFAVALKGCFDPNPVRAGLTAGVQGTLD